VTSREQVGAAGSPALGRVGGHPSRRL